MSAESVAASPWSVTCAPADGTSVSWRQAACGLGYRRAAIRASRRHRRQVVALTGSVSQRAARALSAVPCNGDRHSPSAGVQADRPPPALQSVRLVCDLSDPRDLTGPGGNSDR